LENLLPESGFYWKKNRQDTPAAAWDVVTLDFIEGLPSSAKFDCILVVVDKLTRYAHFIPLSHPFTTQKVAQGYMD
jgi:hypothetical protein